MIRIYHWKPAEKSVLLPGPDALPANVRDLPDGEVLWIDLSNPSEEEERQVLQQFLAIHTLTVEDITRPRRLPEEGAHLPKVEEFPDYLFAIVNPLPWEVCNPKQCLVGGRRGWHRPQLSAVITKQVLVTHHYDPLPCVDALLGYADRHAAMFGRGPDYLFHLILDHLVDEYAPVVERFGVRLSRLETALLREPSPKILASLLKTKRRVLFLRKTLVMEREVLARLVRGEFELVEDREIAYYRNVYDHLVRYTELIEGAREMVSDLMQMYMAANSNKMNEVMKVLAMVSIMVGVPTLIAGIYGMNFENMPEIKWYYGYPLAISLMIVVSLVSFVVFRWKKWI